MTDVPDRLYSRYRMHTDRSYSRDRSKIYYENDNRKENHMDLKEQRYKRKHKEYSCSKLVISGTEHLVEVVDKLSTTTVVIFRSERILKCKHLYGA